MQSLKSLTAPFGLGLSATLAPPFSNESFSGGPFQGGVVGYPAPLSYRSARHEQVESVPPTEAIYSYGQLNTFSDRYLAHAASRLVSNPDVQQASQEAIISRVRGLDLSASPAMEPHETNTYLDSVEHAQLSSKASSGQDRLLASVTDRSRMEDTTRLPYPPLPLHDEVSGYQATTNCMDYDPMWGLSQSYPGTSLGFDSRDSNIARFATSANTSSLASSRSLSDPSLMLDDPWPGRTTTEFLQADQVYEALTKREGGGEYHAGPGNHHQHEGSTGLSNSHGCGHSHSHDLSPLPVDSAMSDDLVATPGPSSRAVGGNIGAGRVEEGRIGSKKRIWYRAPNGQFASAMQVLSGQFVGDQNGGNNGQSSPRSGEIIRRIRRRRKSEEVERKYRCDFDGCDKAYGTLNRKYCMHP